MFKAVISAGNKNITEPNTSPPICLIKQTKEGLKNNIKEKKYCSEI